MRYLPAGSLKVSLQLFCPSYRYSLLQSAPDSGWLYSHSVFIAHTAMMVIGSGCPEVM